MTDAGDIRVLVACEWTGTVRDAFLRRGFDAWSCDRAQDELGSNRHIRADVRTILGDGWGLLIVAHPPCTRLCKSGLRWLHAPPKGRTLESMWRDLDEAADLFSLLWEAPIPHVAVENPRMHRHAQARIRGYVQPTQTIQPWQFGHGETKATCLWLRDLPPLTPTDIVGGRTERVHRMPEGPMRSRERSRFFRGIGDAMADQWGSYVLNPETERQRRAA
jgi:hypothetical protein